MKYLLLLLWITACTYRGDVEFEGGRVIAKQFRGEINLSGSGVAMDMEGNVNVVMTHHHEDQRFDVVFRCDHGVIFTIDRPELYGRVEEGDSVRIEFVPIYHSDPDEAKMQGKYIKPVDIDFLNATVVK